MAKADQLKNLRVLRSFRGPEGTHIPEGAVIPKALLAESDWRTLANMSNPKVEETNDPIYDPNDEDEKPGKKKAAPALPGAV